MNEIHCEHCNRLIKDINDGWCWNRAGHHWCGKTCYQEDHGYLNSPKIIPIDRKGANGNT